MAWSQAPLIARSACLKGLLYFTCIIFDLWFDFGEDFNWAYPPPGCVIVCSSLNMGKITSQCFPFWKMEQRWHSLLLLPTLCMPSRKIITWAVWGAHTRGTHCPPKGLSVPQSSVQQPFFNWDLGRNISYPQEKSVHSAYQLNLKSQVIGTRCYQHQCCSP